MATVTPVRNPLMLPHAPCTCRSSRDFGADALHVHLVRVEAAQFRLGEPRVVDCRALGRVYLACPRVLSDLTHDHSYFAFEAGPQEPIDRPVAGFGRFRKRRLDLEDRVSSLRVPAPRYRLLELFSGRAPSAAVSRAPCTEPALRRSRGTRPRCAPSLPCSRCARRARWARTVFPRSTALRPMARAFRRRFAGRARGWPRRSLLGSWSRRSRRSQPRNPGRRILCSCDFPRLACSFGSGSSIHLCVACRSPRARGTRARLDGLLPLGMARWQVLGVACRSPVTT